MQPHCGCILIPDRCWAHFGDIGGQLGMLATDHTRTNFGVDGVIMALLGMYGNCLTDSFFVFAGRGGMSPIYDWHSGMLSRRQPERALSIHYGRQPLACTCTSFQKNAYHERVLGTLPLAGSGARVSETYGKTNGPQYPPHFSCAVRAAMPCPAGELRTGLKYVASSSASRARIFAIVGAIFGSPES